MNSFWSLDRIASALAMRTALRAPRGVNPIRGISTDTRSLRAGDCYVALVGDNFDGHDFVSAAVKSGATAIIVSRPERIGESEIATYIVDDTLLALGDLASYSRGAWGGPVVGVAGSNGKTSTKELLRAALGARLTVHATTGNLNNRIGVPLTLLATPSEADVAVVELGTSIPGEIAMLREIARPDIAVLTSIAEEHLEGLGDLDGVLREEAEVFAGAGLAVVPSAEEAATALARSAARRVVTAGLGTGDLRATEWSIAEDGTGAVVVDGKRIRSVLRGEHNLRNLMLALAVARELGVSLDDAAEGLASMSQPPMRAAWERIGRALVINDAYNSNPGSARAALDMLAAAPGVQKVALLGTMRELGPGSAKLHDDVARAALASGAHLIGAIGEFADAFRRLANGDPRVVVAGGVEELWEAMEPRIDPAASILLKASRGVKLERILPYITTWAERNC